ncbi:hypothetical protein ACLMJK_004127 [Lecanora helva]
MITLRRAFRQWVLLRKKLNYRGYSSRPIWRSLPELPNGDNETFRQKAFAPSLPALLPRGQFLGLPAISRWFVQGKPGITKTTLNHAYLDGFGTAIVPIELTYLPGETSASGLEDSFQRAEVPLDIFLRWTKLATSDTHERLYIAQASFDKLPKALISDLPAPDLVVSTGVGDIYDSNLWLGLAPTYTPLHRDPNPNLFVQLAGHKIVRMLSPEAGDKAFNRVQSKMSERGSAAFRGEEMMKGEEKKLLDTEIWDDFSQVKVNGSNGYQAHVWGGDGLFIPKGWWHSIKGVDDGINVADFNRGNLEVRIPFVWLVKERHTVIISHLIKRDQETYNFTAHSWVMSVSKSQFKP